MVQHIFQKVSEGKIYFLVLYVDYILLVTNDNGLSYEVKQFLSKHVNINNMVKASYAIDIKIYRDRLQRILDLSQETYINKL